MLATISIILTIIALALMVGMAVQRGIVATWEFSTDFTGDASAATWTLIPVLQVMNDGFQMPREEAQLTQTANGVDVSAGKKNTGILPIAYSDDDSFLAALEAAEEDLTPVWFRVTPAGGGNARIIGGDVGCQVYVNRSPLPQFGQLVNALIGFSATGNNPGDTFRISYSGT